jgi:ribonucleotide monophosphatase NagD (HAD superfamily)
MTTIICDIDGVLVQHTESISSAFILPGTLEKLTEWEKKGYNLILITGRREGMRKVTEEQLAKIGETYDQLIMGVGPGPRYLINDMKTGSSQETAIAINLKRNEGISPQHRLQITIIVTDRPRLAITAI